jgi:GTP-binding protein EngB required for normal cell division
MPHPRIQPYPRNLHSFPRPLWLPHPAALPLLAAHLHAPTPPRFLFAAPSASALPARSTVPEVALLGRTHAGKTTLLNALLSPVEDERRRPLPTGPAGGSRGAANYRGPRRPRRRKDGMAPARDLAGVRWPASTRDLLVFGACGARGGGGRRFMPDGGEDVPAPVRTGGGGGARGFWIEGPERSGREARRDGDGGDPPGPGLAIIDCPGYGPAGRAEWSNELASYILNRRQLRLALLVVDAEAALQPNDAEALALLRRAGVPCQVVLTKCDKIMHRRLLRSFLPVVEAYNQRHTDRVLKAARRVRRDVAAAVAGLEGEESARREAEALGVVATSSVLRDAGARGYVGMDYLRWCVLRATGNIPPHLRATFLPPPGRARRDELGDLVVVEEGGGNVECEWEDEDGPPGDDEMLDPGTTAWIR